MKIDPEIYNLKLDIFTSDYDITTHLINSGDNYYHTHSFYEFFYIVEGEIDHILNGSMEKLKSGDLFFLSPNDLHSFYRESGNMCLHRDIMITKAQWERACGFIDPDLLAELNSLQNVRTFISSEKIMHLESMLSKIAVYSATDKKQYKRLVNLLCIDLIELLITSESSKSAGYPPWLRKLLDKFNMADNYKQGLPKVLSYFNYNSSYICREFKKYIGITMTEYLNNLRLNFSKLLLQAKDSSISQICSDAGFSNLSYFNRLFKEKYNMSPSQYRKEMQKQF